MTADTVSLAPATSVAPLAPEHRPATALRDYWDAHAEEWIAWVRDPDHHDSYWRFHRKRFLSLVPSPGRVTLDIGCGEGRVARDLEELGHHVLGVDWSLKMCRAAASHQKRVGAVAGDAARLPLADDSIDCVIAFMSLHDVDDMPAAIREIARVLADGKKLALAIVHPMYSASGKSVDGAYVFKRAYLDSELCMSTDERDSSTMTFCREHRPLAAYFDALLEAGFDIERLHELTDNDKPGYRGPMFLDILATRRPRPRGPRAHATLRRARALRACIWSGSLLSGLVIASLAFLVIGH
jgi:SAM-dependent methyltransferase